MTEPPARRIEQPELQLTIKLSYRWRKWTLEVHGTEDGLGRPEKIERSLPKTKTLLRLADFMGVGEVVRATLRRIAVFEQQELAAHRERMVKNAADAEKYLHEHITRARDAEAAAEVAER